MDVTEIYEVVEKQVEYIIEKKTFDFSSLPEIFKLAMEAVELKEEWSGDKKREVVLTVVGKVLEALHNKQVISDLVYGDLNLALQTIGGPMITLVISATKGLLKLNVVQSCQKCCIIA